MLSYCLECRKKAEIINPNAVSKKMEEWYFYKTVLFAAVKK